MSQSAVLDIQKLVQLIEDTITHENSESTRILSFLRECRQLGVEILPVDINMSGASCSIEDEKNIRIGFSLLVSEKEQFIEDILAERQQNGQFYSFQDFCERIDLDSIPEDFIIRCIQVGAFDSIEISRSRLFLGREKILQAVRKANAERSAGQFSLFTTLQDSSESQILPIELPEAEEWTEEEIIAQEKEAIGFSLTEYLEVPADEIESSLPQKENEPSLFQEEVDESSLPQEIESGDSVIVPSEEDTLTEEVEITPSIFIIQLPTTTTTEQTLLQLREVIEKYPGNSEALLEFVDAKNTKIQIRTHADYSVHISEDLIKETEAVIGEHTTRAQ
jgi:DNA polymerase-3 subunit alpha